MKYTNSLTDIQICVNNLKNNIQTEPQHASYSIFFGQNMIDVSDGIEGIPNNSESEYQEEEKTGTT